MTAFLSQTLVPTLFNMSLTASIVILCVLVARLILKRAPKVFSYALWAVVLFRLLCPVSLSSGFSLLGALDAPARQASPVVSTVTYVQPQQPVAVPPQAEPLPREQEGTDPAPVTPVTPEQTAAPVDWTAVAAWVWLAGAVGLAGYSVFALLRLRRRLVGSLRVRDNIYLADHIATPFVLGLVQPRIYLPSTLTEGELGYIIRHEQYHIRHGDHIVKVFAFAALCLHWFNPLVWAAFVLAGKDMEMRCDEAVVKQLGEGVRADYSASLLALATGRPTIAGTPLAFGEGDPKGRIHNLLRWKRPKLWLSVAAGVACVAVIAACAANPAGQESPNPTASDMTGQYADMEDFARQTMENAKEVTYYTPSGEAAAAQVTGTKLAWLDKQGELEGLAPEGTLEAWTFSYLVQLDVPTEKVALVGGMYEEDGWFDLEGQGGHNIVALRYPDGSYDILYDQPVNDNLDFYGYRNSYEEAIYDWYVTDQGLDLPRYVEEWSDRVTYPGEYQGNLPVHRYDGDGWYLYVPVSGWTMRADGSNGNNWEWRSEYRNSSVYLMVNRITAEWEEVLTAYQQMDYVPVDQEQRVWQLQGNGLGYRYLIEGAEGQFWEIITYCPDSQADDYVYIFIEPQVLQLMAHSFTVTEQTGARPTERQAVRDAKQTLLQQLEQGAYRLEVATGQEVRVLTAGDIELRWLQAMGEVLLWREDFPGDFYALPGSLSLVLDEDHFFCFTPGGEVGQIMVDYVADGTTTSCWMENIQSYLWLTAVIQEETVEMHDLDGDRLLEAVTWLAGERNLVLYDCYDGQIQTLNVKQKLGAEFADYTGLIGNIQREYDNMVEATVDGETGVYQYDDGILTYVCSLEDALLA